MSAAGYESKDDAIRAMLGKTFTVRQPEAAYKDAPNQVALPAPVNHKL